VDCGEFGELHGGWEDVDKDVEGCAGHYVDEETRIEVVVLAGGLRWLFGMLLHRGRHRKLELLEIADDNERSRLQHRTTTQRTRSRGGLNVRRHLI
jgi:hypothetical protein